MSNFDTQYSITIIYHAEIEKIISSTKESLYICMPTIHEEFENAIKNLYSSQSNSETEIQIH